MKEPIRPHLIAGTYGDLLEDVRKNVKLTLTEMDEIMDNNNYTQEDKPIEAKLALEGYFFFKGRIDEPSLDFTSKHEGADWPQVKKIFQELRRSGLVYESFF